MQSTRCKKLLSFIVSVLMLASFSAVTILAASDGIHSYYGIGESTIKTSTYGYSRPTDKQCSEINYLPAGLEVSVISYYVNSSKQKFYEVAYLEGDKIENSYVPASTVNLKEPNGNYVRPLDTSGNWGIRYVNCQYPYIYTGPGYEMNSFYEIKEYTVKDRLPKGTKVNYITKAFAGNSSDYYALIQYTDVSGNLAWGWILANDLNIAAPQ